MAHINPEKDTRPKSGLGQGLLLWYLAHNLNPPLNPQPICPFQEIIMWYLTHKSFVDLRPHFRFLGKHAMVSGWVIRCGDHQFLLVGQNPQQFKQDVGRGLNAGTQR